MTGVFYKYQRKKDGGAEVTVVADGTIVDFLQFIGNLVQTLHAKLPEPLRPMFRYALGELVKEDSFVFEPAQANFVISADAEELKRQLMEEQGEN